ncbi:MAG: hypothetical protein RMM98_05590 [Acidobacteriota bacterium]|nr:hypothetical protein [Acidobacteriota bacterium]
MARRYSRWLQIEAEGLVSVVRLTVKRSRIWHQYALASRQHGTVVRLTVKRSHL